MTTERSELLASARKLATKFPRRKPQFEFDIGWSDDYDHLLAGSNRSTSAVDQVLPEAFKTGRVLLHGDGGSGKTSIVLRLFQRAVDNESVPLVIDLRRWNPSISKRWEELVDSDLLRLELVLADLGLGVSDYDGRTLVEATFAGPTIVFADGLNEAPNPYPDQILVMLELVARTNPQSAVVVTDRLLRRQLPSESWQVAAIRGAFAPGAVPATVDENSGLMRSAFFLDLKINQGLDSSSGSAAFRQYFSKHAGLVDDELPAAARAAFDAYLRWRSRNFDLGRFTDVAGGDVVDRLLEAGTIVEADSWAFFKHHLFHDYLAASWLAEHAEEWHRQAFDAVTFDANSFDVLALALQEIEDSDSADSLLRAIYDWNYYGSSYALARGRSLGAVHASEGMELALLAMLAERRWDLVQPTAQRVGDALALFPSQLAKRLRNADDLESIIDIVKAAVLPAELEPWRSLFTTSPEARVGPEIVELLDSRESLLGWTSANVLRRVQLTSSQQSDVRRLLRQSQIEVVRWRSAHVLGAHVARDNADVLVEALEDGDQWVRYGAIRSLIELAARSDELRDRILEVLLARTDRLADDPKVIEELERAILLRRPPVGWETDVAPILEQFWAAAPTIEEQDHWRQVAARVHATTRG